MPCRLLFRWFLDLYADVEFRPEGWITPETRFLDLNVESLDYVEWLLLAEERFGVRFSELDAERMITIGDYLRFIRQNATTQRLSGKDQGRNPLWDSALDG